MSVDLASRNAVVHAKQQLLRTSVLSRKRKLSQLFEVTLNRGVADAPPTAPRGAPSHDHFLALNDIEQGKYFDESTLPASLHELTLKSISLPPPAAVAHPSPAPASDASTQPPPPGPLANPVAAEQSPATLHHHAQSSMPPSALAPSDPGAERPSSSTLIATPTSTDTPAHQPGGPSLPNLSSQPQTAHADQTRPPNAPGVATAITPKVAVPQAVPQSAMVDGTVTAKPHADTTMHTRPEGASSPSSTVGHRSNNTSREDGHSPATSPDEDSSAHPIAAHLRGDILKPSQRPPTDVPSPESRRGSIFEVKRDDDAWARITAAHARQGATQKPPRKHQPASNTSQVITPAPSGQDDDSPQASPQPKRQTDAMDVDEADPPIESIQASVVKPRKRRRFSAPRKPSLIVGKLDKAITRQSQQYPRPADGRLKDPREDYMYLLFHKEAHDKAYKHDLISLLGGANKALMTSEWISGHREKQDCAIIKRVYDLQQRGMWSLRQPKPAQEPEHGLSHQDWLLRHVKWLQTDFREERKLKVDVCYQLAFWCAEFVNATEEERSKLRTHAKVPVPASEEMDTSLDSAIERHDHAEMTAIVKNEEEELVLHGEFLNKLPLFVLDDPPLRASKRLKIRNGNEYGAKLFASETMPHLPTEFDLNPDLPIDEDKPAAPEIAPEEATCALFDPQNKMLRARVNAQWPFRPPSGPNVLIPPQGFYENRQASQWTQEDDAQLRGYVKDFPSNWDLISDRLAPRTKFPSTRDRRTPWECFERLVSMEGPPQDPSSKPYVKYFMSRIEQARNRFNSSQAAALQQAQQTPTSATPVTTMQQRFPAPMRIERRASNRRFLGLLDGARKLARRRENAQSKQQQQQAAHEAATQAPKAPRSHPPHTPAHMSRIKYEQQVQLAKRQEQVRQQAKALQLQQQQARQSGNQPLYAGLSQRIGNGAGGTSAHANGHLTVPGQGQGQGRVMPPQGGTPMALPNGAKPSGQLAQMVMNGRAQGSMSSQQQQQQQQQQLLQQMNNDQNMQQLMAQQRNLQQMQQQQSQFQRGSPNMVKGMTTGNNNGGSNGMASMHGVMSNGTDGVQSPRIGSVVANKGSAQQSPTAATATTAGNGAQHRRTPSQSQAHQLSSGHVPAIYAMVQQLQARKPGLSQEEAMQQAKAQLLQQSRQNALNAASGVHGISSQHNANSQMQPPPPPSGPGSPYQQANGMPANFTPNGAMLGSNAMQGRSSSPTNAQTTQQYQQQMRQQIYQQRMATTGMGSPGTPSASPAMGNVQMNGMSFNPNGTVANGNGQLNTNMAGVNMGQNQMRPPSRSNATAMGMNMGNGASFDQQQAAQQVQQAQQRPNSAQMSTPRLASQSPRPLSSQGPAQ